IIADFIRMPTQKELVFDPKEFLNQPEDWTRNKLAFDKCTLLSSQGSDAPTVQPRGITSRARSHSRSLRLATNLSRELPIILDDLPQGKFFVEMGFVRRLGSQAFRPFALPLGANK
ncbi:hypothetical protein, partial [Microbacterium sp.]|uniref:hypothetical protein n=1 Tax=Microbacterium sp. TaxID=51671 RepID=UPI001ACB3487